MKQVEIFCDGSSLGNPGAGGWCAIMRYQEVEKVLSGGEINVTNNQMELRAVIESLKALKFPCHIILYSDSRYVCEGINTWLKSWVQKDFKNVKNPTMWQEFLDVSCRHLIEARWVKGHNGHPENERCDKIAKAEASKRVNK
ncbi:ribonuclease HI [Helicobacter enhydrae]|uniref:ribonuclease H n=1 Tax=Helicobacter enhydrae TaxID=222136 RepID=A0A1B1U7W6_9HELI|nr:ribonuclease HI [Helicobacter enhydrae]ANV98775.1 ribonuclease HI [Helicobacter enhydrae]